MNEYGKKALEHWRRYAPQRVERMDDPETFFSDLGLEISGQISDLARQLEANSDLSLAMAASSRETGSRYLPEVARRMTARRIAEEVVMDELVWIHDPSLPLDEARQEWEETRASDENLISWAERIQDAPDLMPATVDLEQKAKDWAVPTWFLEGLTSAEIPRQYANEHQEILAEAANVRFLREVR